MSRELLPDFEAELLLPPRIEDWVGDRHCARFVREFVLSLDLAALGFQREVKALGRRPIGTFCLVAAWVYGFMAKHRSTRDLERACRNDMGAIWLTGNLQPDHSTLSEFFRSHREAFRTLLRQSALVACRMGLVELKVVAIDGTKIRASASESKTWSAMTLKGVMESLDKEISDYMEAVNGASDSGAPELPESIQTAKLLKEAVTGALKEIEELGVSRVSLVDPEARTMKTKEGQRLSYNAQAVVDALNGIIVSADVTQDANDSGQLSAMIGGVARNLGAIPATVLADTGYFAGDEITAALSLGTEIAVSMHGHEPNEKTPFHSWNFEMDKDLDILSCPIGGELTYRSTGPTHGGKDTVRRYRCPNASFCPLASSCSSDRRGRVVEVSPYRRAVLALWKKRTKAQMKQLMRQRGATVERIFGHAKATLGLRQLDHRGLENVKTVWSMAVCAINLKAISRRQGYGF